MSQNGRNRVMSVEDVRGLDVTDLNDNGADQAVKTTIIPGWQKRNKMSPTTSEGWHTSLILHCRYVSWKQHPQSFQLLHLPLQRQLQKGMTTLQVNLLQSCLHPWEITQAKLSNLNNTIKPRGPVAYKLGWSLLSNNLITYISFHIQLKEVSQRTFRSCFYTMH